MVTLTPSAATRRWTGASPPVLLAIAALVFVGVCGGLALSEFLGRVSALWIANAIIVFFLLKHPRGDWPALLIVALCANFCADLFMGDDFATSVALTFCNTVGVVIVAAPLE
jgi:integral membrane sensor domain MASE1